MPYRMTPSVRHRAIEVHYYYYYYYSVPAVGKQSIIQPEHAISIIGYGGNYFMIMACYFHAHSPILNLNRNSKMQAGSA